MPKVSIIGIGPGTEGYLLPIAKKEIERADTLIAAKRALPLFQHLNKEIIYLEGHFKDVISYINKNRRTKRIALLVSGDPGLYSLLGKVKRALKKEEYTVIPGVSALQIAFAKIRESWEDAKIISLHGRKFGTSTSLSANGERPSTTLRTALSKRSESNGRSRTIGSLAKEVKAHSKVFLLTDPDSSPDKIASYLLDKGIEKRRVIVFERLSYPDERIIKGSLKAISKIKGFKLCVMIIKKGR